MSSDLDIGAAFDRALSFFPGTDVTIACPQSNLKAGWLGPVSVDPPMVALTLPKPVAGLPHGEFSVCGPAKLHCRLAETKEIGDHVMIFAAVCGVEIHAGAPVVRWRHASFGLRLDYPFLGGADALENFVNAWVTGLLPKPAWTHAAHIAVSGYYAFDASADRVYDRMKRGILYFNSCVGVVNGPNSGYHETLTRFWSNTIASAVRNGRRKSRFDAAVHAVERFGEDRDLPRLFYSFDVVRDRRARVEWVPPDRSPRPEWLG
jgi:hypothetical protein